MPTTAKHQPVKNRSAAQSRRSWSEKLFTPLALGISSTVFIIIGVVWFFLTFAPVLAVEAQYQYRTFLTHTFGTSSLRHILLPNVTWDFQGVSQRNREFGIVIPKIFLDEPVVFNVDPNKSDEYQVALKKGIAHASSTAFPNNGGVGYYFAHSSSPEFHRQYNAIFYTLGKLEPGDDIYIWFEDEKYHYQVRDSIVTSPDDVSFLNQEYDEETIVLQTCWPPGTTSKRKLIFAQRVK